MPVTFHNQRIGPAPALLAWRDASAGPLPVVLWFHGFTADKDTNRPELEWLAEAGFLAIGIDAAGHGERRLDDFDQRLGGSPEHRHRLFLALVAQTVAEVPTIVDALSRIERADPRRLAVCGVSMGGCIVYGAVATERRIRAAAALLGSPAWTGRQDSYPRASFPAALLSITAGCDDVVPPAAARALHEELVRHYHDRPHALRYREIPGAGHMLDRQDWEAALREVSAWFSTHTA